MGSTAQLTENINLYWDLSVAKILLISLNFNNYFTKSCQMIVFLAFFKLQILSDFQLFGRV